jgi:hypothetical protein
VKGSPDSLWTTMDPKSVSEGFVRYHFGIDFQIKRLHSELLSEGLYIFCLIIDKMCCQVLSTSMKYKSPVPHYENQK